MRSAKNRKAAKTLADFPNLLKEWDEEKNGDIDPRSVGSRSHKKCWWVCSEGHRWQQVVDRRTRSNHLGCPYCSGKLPSENYNFANSYPELAKQWHPIKNLELKPNSITPQAAHKVWWVCDKGHEYDMVVAARARGRNCPFCSGKRTDAQNNLAANFPAIAAEWHPTKNGTLKPTDVTSSSGKKAWWFCHCGHEWETYVYSRTGGNGCPSCSGRVATASNNLEQKFPELIAEWHPQKNGELKPAELTPGSGKQVWWICPNGHEWAAIVSSRTSQGTGCPTCSRQTSIPDLRIYSEVQAIWPQAKLRAKVGRDEVDVLIEKVKLAIEYDGEYYHRKRTKKDAGKQQRLEKAGWSVFRFREAPLQKLRDHDVVLHAQLKKADIDQLLFFAKQLNGMGEEAKLIDQYITASGFQNETDFQRYLSYYPLPIPEKSLANLHPKICDEWCYEKNGSLTPEHFSPGSNQKVWWRCELGHQYQSSIAHRTGDGTGCPFCGGKLPTAEANAANNPVLVAEYDDRKNSKSLNEYRPQSHAEVWWICDKNHEWKAPISKRSSGRGCPFCSGKRATKENNLEVYRPDIAFQWHPTKNGNLKPVDVLPKSSKVVWWRCKDGHEWEARISARSKSKGNCPVCGGLHVVNENNLANKFPELMKEWDFLKNAGLDPKKLSPKSHKKVWWLCRLNHRWETSISNRTHNGSDCPYCNRQLASPEFNLAVEQPSIANEWHPTLNGTKSPQDFLPGSGKRVWWLCSHGHAWEAFIYKRSAGGSNCPECKGLAKLNKRHPK